MSEINVNGLLLHGGALATAGATVAGTGAVVSLLDAIDARADLASLGYERFPVKRVRLQDALQAANRGTQRFGIAAGVLAVAGAGLIGWALLRD